MWTHRWNDDTEAAEMTSKGPRARYRVIGMDCASDAAEIEKAAGGIEGVERAKVSTASQIMTVAVDDPATRLAAVEQAVTGLGYRLSLVAESACASGDDELSDLTHVTPTYRRALWVVVLLNVGYGVVEMVGGFLAGSQAVKADGSTLSAMDSSRFSAC